MSTLAGEAADRQAIRDLVDACTVTLEGDRASGETYCLAHHVREDDGQRTLLVLSIRYPDTFVRDEGGWRFAERRLITDWSDRRPFAA